MPPTRPDGYSPCSGPIHRTPLAAVAHRSLLPKVARTWHEARSSFRRRHSTHHLRRHRGPRRSRPSDGSSTAESANAGRVVGVGPHPLRPSSPHSGAIHAFLRAVRDAVTESRSCPGYPEAQQRRSLRRDTCRAGGGRELATGARAARAFSARTQSARLDRPVATVIVARWSSPAMHSHGSSSGLGSPDPTPRGPGPHLPRVHRRCGRGDRVPRRRRAQSGTPLGPPEEPANRPRRGLTLEREHGVGVEDDHRRFRRSVEASSFRDRRRAPRRCWGAIYLPTKASMASSGNGRMTSRSPRSTTSILSTAPTGPCVSRDRHCRWRTPS